MSAKKEFKILKEFFKKKEKINVSLDYYIPEILIGGNSYRKMININNPYKFYYDCLNKIEKLGNQRDKNVYNKSNNKKNGLTPKDLVYQSHIRNFAALNGERGTALKQIAFLPMLAEKLGITVFISLPTGVIGNTNRKGGIGSPFAISNPFGIDNSLCDPLVPNISPMTQYKALLQSCELLGIRTGSIVPLVTMSIDSPLFKKFPDLGYWWIAHPGEYLYCDSSSKNDYSNNAEQDPIYLHNNLPELSDDIKCRFVHPPKEITIKIREHRGQSYYVGSVERNGKEYPITLANAFPDVFAGEQNSYTWADVATINYTGDIFPPVMGLHCKQQFDSTMIAYKLMPHIIAWRALELGEEVFLVDVCCNIPEEIINESKNIVRSNTENYNDKIKIIIDDNKNISDAYKFFDSFDCKSYNTDHLNTPNNASQLCFIGEELWNYDKRNNSVDAVTGPLIFCVSSHTYNPPVLVESLRYHLKLLEKRESTNYYLAGVANHDTMPCLPAFSPLLYVTYFFLPEAVPFIFSGAEFHAQNITNKEFGLNTSEDLLRLRDSLDDSMLGLFNDFPLEWTSLPTMDHRGRPVVDLLQLINQLNEIRHWALSKDLHGYRFVGTLDRKNEDNCFGYLRYIKEDRSKFFFIFCNWDEYISRSFIWPYDQSKILLAVNNPDAQQNIKKGQELIMPYCSALIAISNLLV